MVGFGCPPRRCRGGQILPLQERVGKQPGHDIYVRVDEGFVALTTDARVTIADVGGILQQILAIGADVEHDRDDTGGIDASGGGVDRQFADRYLRHSGEMRIAKTPPAVAAYNRLCESSSASPETESDVSPEFSGFQLFPPSML
jgi:hypothetical protein